MAHVSYKQGSLLRCPFFQTSSRKRFLNRSQQTGFQFCFPCSTRTCVAQSVFPPSLFFPLPHSNLMRMPCVTPHIWTRPVLRITVANDLELGRASPITNSWSSAFDKIPSSLTSMGQGKCVFFTVRTRFLRTNARIDRFYQMPRPCPSRTRRLARTTSSRAHQLPAQSGWALIAVRGAAAPEDGKVPRRKVPYCMCEAIVPDWIAQLSMYH